jgi:hypothetical protein
MKTFVTTLLVLGALLLVTAAYATDAKHPEAKANPAFDKIKSLAGDWEAKVRQGEKEITAGNRFTVISGGSAVLIGEEMPGEGSMITVVHPDGSDLLATHYCAVKNQPRFVAVPSTDPNKIVFKFKDATNLASPQAGHMNGVTFTLVDADHHTQEWLWSENGKEQKETFNFVRKK